MKVTTLDTQVAEQIGHAFGYYDYGEEVGMHFTAARMRSQRILPGMFGWHLKAVCSMRQASGARVILLIRCRDRN